jgi:YjbE family integral membrane protein
MGSIAQYLNPLHWAEWLQVSAASAGYTAFWAAVLQIFFINLLLSGDNAVVIAMACRGLPPREKFWGMVLGAGVAIALRVVFTVVIAALMALPYLKLVGGLVLFYIASRLLLPERTDKDKDEVAAGVHLWPAIWIIVVADIVMSLDNVVAVAAAARGSFALLALGLALSIPVILAGAAAVTALLERFPFIVWAGAALLGWIAGKIVATDPRLWGYLTSSFGDKAARHVELAAAGAGALLVVAAGGLWRQFLLAKARGSSVDGQTS